VSNGEKEGVYELAFSFLKPVVLKKMKKNWLCFFLNREMNQVMKPFASA
jgi:hypothetical protein